jgi:hypothetical protein
MSVRNVPAAAFIMIALLAAVPSAARAEPASCAVPPDLALTGQPLPMFQAALAAHRPVTILAVGGASTAGAAGRGDAFTFPARLEAHLRDRLPGASITVVNRGVAGKSAVARVSLMTAELGQFHPALVIWAPGSTEAGLSEDIAPFEASLREGVARIRDAGADLILIDLQFAPSVARVVALDRYNETIAGVAEAEEVPLIHRSEWMRYWNDTGVLDLDNTPAKDIVPAIRRLFDCLAIGVADTIATSVP